MGGGKKIEKQRRRMLEEQRKTYHIQCLLHKTKMNLPLGSLRRILGLFERLNSWWQGEIVLTILDGLSVTSGIDALDVDVVGDVAESSLDRFSIHGRILLDVSILSSWRDLHAGSVIEDGILRTVRVLRPCGGGRAWALHGIWIAVVVAVVDILVLGCVVTIPISVLVVVLSLSGGKNMRGQEVKDGLENTNNEGEYGVKKRRGPATWTV